ncbi:uncharacterized protein LOC114849111 isoform X2 [Betta splendens]|uniref:D-aminoacyl-tRNA deacylase n=1 Tax=Betta splendens TaxID=158456 RepID=A0A8M1HA29_BETSP|nr:uncharacterized protein LOC114849111 isoform X2 [Betta splendens]
MGRKATFDFIDKVELFLRTGTFPADATKNSKKVIRASSKRFSYKDGCLWRHYRGRLLRVVRSDEEVREILTRYHDNNNHAGQGRTVKEIMMMYYWAGVTPAVKKWIKECSLCHNRTRPETQEAPIQCCLVYNCEANSFVCPEISFHRFPKDTELRRKWLLLAQRDEGSLRFNSYVCSKHFEPSCFTQNEGEQLTLSPDAVPTVYTVVVKGDEVLIPSEDDILDSNTLEELLFACDTEAINPSESAIDLPETSVELQEHQYCLTAPNPYSRAMQTTRTDKERRISIDPSFGIYNQIARYLSHRAIPLLSKKNRSSFVRRARCYSLIDGVLMYSRVSPPVRVPRNREEVNSILQQFHDNQGHIGQGVCQREITKHFYWRNMTRDLSSWIASCQTCLNRNKRKWLRCSVYCCTNCCGPVERGLGLTFHKFPLHNSSLLAQWLKAVGRANWHPRLRSSVCSAHFTEDCFDRSGDKVSIYPGAVPTLLLPRETAAENRGPTESAVGEEAYFAKFDAVELYLRRRIYPPGLNYVEKNTFRRFCKNFNIKDDELHFVKRNRVSLVLRSREQIEVVLTEYHNELNHLDVKKCLRLLSERFFWKAMRRDVVQWINNCSQCNKKKLNQPKKQTEPRGSESLLQALGSTQTHDEDSDSGKDETSYNDDDDGGDADEGNVSCGNAEAQPAARQSSTPDTGPVLVQNMNHPQSEVAHETNILDVQPDSQHSQTELQEQTPPHQNETCRSEGSARTHHCIPGRTTQATKQPPPAELIAKPPQCTSEPPQPPTSGLKAQSKCRTSSQSQSSQRVQRVLKRKRAPEESPSPKRSSGLEPVVAPSSKPWPVFTISHSTQPHVAKSTPEAHSKAPVHGSKKGARAVIQQCSQAKVKIRPALNEADAQWAEIQTGMVVYVCFFDGATEDVAYEMANCLMTTRIFRKSTRQAVSILELPGSVLFIPQDSLVWEPAPKKKVQYKGMCEPWWGAQLFSTLVSTCIDLMSDSAKCKTAGAKVEQGVYGQKQEIVFSSVEPLTLLLEF